MLVAARWIHFAALSLLVGSATFRLFVAPDWRRPETPWRIVLGAAIVSGAVWLAALVATIAGVDALGDPAMVRLLTVETPFGAPALLRLALLAALAMVALAPLRAPRADAAMLVVGGLLLAGQAWFGHAAQGGRHAQAMVLAYTIHVVAAAAWAGSLPALALALRDRRAEGAAIRVLLMRYSVLATACVALVLASGTANTLFHVSGLPALPASRYGALLGVKLGLVAVMLGLAGRVRWGQGRRPARTVTIEAALALAVFAAAALLGLTPPP